MLHEEQIVSKIIQSHNVHKVLRTVDDEKLSQLTRQNFKSQPRVKRNFFKLAKGAYKDKGKVSPRKMRTRLLATSVPFVYLLTQFVN